MRYKGFPRGLSDASEESRLVAVDEAVDHGEQHPVHENRHACCRLEHESFHLYYLQRNGLMKQCAHALAAFA